MSSDKEIKEKAEEGLKRCISIAQEIIKIIARHEIKLGQLTNEEKDKYYDPIAKEILDLMVEKNLLYLEKDFVFQLVLQAIEQTREKVEIFVVACYSYKRE
jgi:hypothetical protein